MYGRVAPHSGLSTTRSILAMGGVVDEDYRENIIVFLINLGRESYLVRIRDRVAELNCEKSSRPAAVIREQISLYTIRGVSGYNLSGN